jgi:hypothetical protein
VVASGPQIADFSERVSSFGTPQRQAAAFGASTGLQIATTLALPVLALPAIIGGAPVDHSLATGAYLGLGVLVLLFAAGVAAFATRRRSSSRAARSSGS